MTQLPWMKQYHRDFLAETEGWLPEEKWHYMRLQMHQWDHGSIPLEPKRLEMISPGVSAVWSLLAPLFPEGRNEKLAASREETLAKRERRVESGRLGGLANQAKRSQTGGNDGPHGGTRQPRQPSRSSAPVAPVQANGQASHHANGVARGVALLQATPQARLVASSELRTQSSEPNPPNSSLPAQNPYPGKRDGGDSSPAIAAATEGVIGSIGPSGRVGSGGQVPKSGAPAPDLANDPRRALRDELASGMAALVERPAARLACLAAIENMTMDELKRAKRDLVQVRSLDSPGGALVHRWTRTAAAVASRRRAAAR